MGRTQNPGTLVRKLAGDVRLPAKSTVHAVRKQAAVMFERRLSEASRCQEAVCQMCMFCIAYKRFSSNCNHDVAWRTTQKQVHAEPKPAGAEW